MCVEVMVIVNGVPAASGTYRECAGATGYAEGTLASYASLPGGGPENSPVKVVHLEPLYRLWGHDRLMGEREACWRTCCDKDQLHQVASDKKDERAVRHRREPWALPAEMIQWLQQTKRGRA